MKIDISNVQNTKNLVREAEVSIEMESFQSKLGEFAIVKKEPFTLCLENQENKRLLISGETDVALKMPCDRCLEPVSVPVRLRISQTCSLEDEEAEGREDGEDADFLEGSVLDIDKLAYRELLVSRPLKVLCKEDCRGICRKCGVNLNHEACSCDQSELDPRMAAIQDIFHQFKEV